MTTRPLHGIVWGRTIELSEDPGVPQGQSVEVLVTLSSNPRPQWGDGLRRCAGALAGDWSDEDDRILEELQQERKIDVRTEFSE